MLASHRASLRITLQPQLATALGLAVDEAIRVVNSEPETYFQLNQPHERSLSKTSWLFSSGASWGKFAKNACSLIRSM